MGLEKVHHTYARLLSQHSLGHALYHPVTADNLRPGSIGFFDDNGHWCTLANYPGVIPVTSVFRTPANSVDVGVSVDGTLGGIPAAIDASLRASGHLNEGAVFYCEHLVREAFEQGKVGLKDWGTENAEQIFREEKLTREFGFFVVTGVSRTTSCCLKCWSNAEKSVKPMLNIGPSMFPSVSVHVNGEATEIGYGSTWVTFPNDPHPRLSIDPEYVVFVEGYLFVPRRLGEIRFFTSAFSNRAYRTAILSEDNSEDDESEAFMVEIDEKEAYEVECQNWTSPSQISHAAF